MRIGDFMKRAPGCCIGEKILWGNSANQRERPQDPNKIWQQLGLGVSSA